MAFKVFNYIALQAMWLVCVVFGSQGEMLWPSAGFVLFLVVHFYFTSYKKSDLIVCVASVLGGMILDTLWSTAHLIHYGQNALTPIAPIWIAYLWCAFALTINHCMAWLKNRYILACLFSAVSGPVSFYAATKVGQIELINLPIAFVLLALTWGGFVPALCYLAQRTVQQPKAQGAGHAIA